MTIALMLAFTSFAFVSSITPGPNNAMVLASGVNYGFRRTLPHIGGISLGCVVMLLLVGLGLGAVFAAVPVIYTVLRYTAAAYLIWLAWQIARSGPVAECQTSGRPLTFWQAAGFQWVNPKAWILIVGAVSAYAPRDGFALDLGVLALLLSLVSVSCVSLWAGFGTMLRPFLSHPHRARMFNAAMAVLLVLSLLPILH